MRAAVFAGVCLAMFRPLVNSQVLFTSTASAQNDGQAIVTNKNSSPLVALAFWISNEPCAPMDVEPETLRIIDAATSPDHKPIAPGQTETISIGSKRCNKVGTITPAKARFGAAIFQNGTTYGDRQLAERILANRRAISRQKGGQSRPR